MWLSIKYKKIISIIIRIEIEALTYILLSNYLSNRVPMGMLTFKLYAIYNILCYIICDLYMKKLTLSNTLHYKSPI